MRAALRRGLVAELSHAGDDLHRGSECRLVEEAAGLGIAVGPLQLEAMAEDQHGLRVADGRGTNSTTAQQQMMRMAESIRLASWPQG